MRGWGSISQAPGAAHLIVAALLFATTVHAQLGQQPTPPTTSAGSLPSSQTAGRTGTSSISTEDPFAGSVIAENATDQVITISLKEAINRGLKANLGALLTEQGITSARAQRWRALQSMLPDVTARVGESVQQVNLAASGIRFPGVPTVIGPFSNFDVRAYLTANAGLTQYESIRSSVENLKAAQFSYQNALELVVYSVSNAYLQVLTAGANVVNAQAQVETAQALVNQAEQMHQAGVTAKIDGLRAVVELQARKQDLVVARNNLEKSKITLARTIGLPVEQKYELADILQFIPAPAMTQEEAVHRAYQMRFDYRQAQAQVRAAELSERGAHFERLPSLSTRVNIIKIY